MKKWKERISITKLDAAVLLGLILFFGYFLVFCEVRELSDSFQYLHQFVAREPVYALLLQLLTTIFGAKYTILLGIIQNLLAVFSVYWLYKRIGRLIPMGNLSKIMTVLILLAPHIVTPLISKTGMIITNSVLTEGIAVSLYYIWFGMMLSILLHYYSDHYVKQAVLSLLLSLLISMIRGQLMVCMIAWMIVMMFCAWREKKSKKILLIFLITAIAFASKTQLTKIYNYLESGLYVNTVSSKPMLLANAVYVADLKDGTGIEDTQLKNAYEDIIRGIEDNKLSIKNAKGSIIEQANFHEAGHEIINFDYIVPALNEYTKLKDGIDESEYFALLIKQDEYAGKMFQELLPNIYLKFIKNYFVIASLGFVRSVAVDISILSWYALFIYLAAIILLFVLFRKNKASASGYFMLLVLLLICGTVFGTSIMIECISRYMIYNLPLFYIAGIGMINEWIRGRRKDKENGI